MLPSGEWEPVEIGESDADVYRRADGAEYAKCADLAGVGELRDERDRIVWLAGTGLPGATVADWIETDAGACLVTTAVPGVAAADLPASAYDRATEQLAGVLRALHDLDPADCPFTRPLTDVVRQAEDVVRRGAVNPDFLNDEWRAERPEDLLARIQADLPRMRESADLVVCHGDACLPNLFVDPETLAPTGLIDLGRLGTADRYTDLALVTTQLRDEWNADPAPFLKAYGHPDADPAKLAFYLLLDPLTWG
nr:APH(3') family aminoglycoside O-phosphotransferase [Kribbella amoyensis]